MVQVDQFADALHVAAKDRGQDGAARFLLNLAVELKQLRVHPIDVDCAVQVHFRAQPDRVIDAPMIIIEFKRVPTMVSSFRGRLMESIQRHEDAQHPHPHLQRRQLIRRAGF
ncbi:MAG: hypothetical protein ACR2P7_09225 [bacterium]